MDKLELVKRWLMWGTGAVLVAALIGTGAATVIRAHGGDSSVVHAGVNNASGQVQIVGPDDSCRKNWTAVDWSITPLPSPISSDFP